MVKTSASTNPRGNLWLKDKNRVGLKLMQKMGWSEGRGLGSKEDGMKEPIKVRFKNDSKDKNRVGLKLMQKMGWSEGRGLGSKEDGIKEPIKARFKNDTKGVGFHENNDNNWLEHQDEFNALLNRLNENNAETSTKMISLEEKSKSSKSRLHYHKYTRGKDLSSCSDKDLACILGKRKKDRADEESESSDVGVSKISSRDYFLQKKGLLEKNHEEYDSTQIVSTAAETPEKDDPEVLSEADKGECDSLQQDDCVSKKKKHKRKKETSTQETDEGFLVASKEECDSLEMTQTCVNKKKHKRKKDISVCNFEEEANEVVEQIDETPVKKRKHEKLESPGLIEVDKVKNKPDLGTCEDTSQNLEQSFKDDKTESLDGIETISKKHKKEKKKLLLLDIVDDELEVKSCIQTRKRKLRSCNDDAHLEEDCIQIDLNDMEMEVKPSKKKLKKIKSQTDRNDETTLIEDKINNEDIELSTSELEITKKEKPKLKRTDDKKAFANDTAEDDSVINKKEFVIALLATFRQPSENLPDLFNDIMKGELFNGSNFFSIKGYGDEWL